MQKVKIGYRTKAQMSFLKWNLLKMFPMFPIIWLGSPNSECFSSYDQTHGQTVTVLKWNATEKKCAAS